MSEMKASGRELRGKYLKNTNTEKICNNSTGSHSPSGREVSGCGSRSGMVH